MSDQLSKMGDYSGMVPFLIETAKKKGVRLDIADFDNENVERLNEHVVIFRGRSLEIIDRLFKRTECSASAMELPVLDFLSGAGGNVWRKETMRIEVNHGGILPNVTDLPRLWLARSVRQHDP